MVMVPGRRRREKENIVVSHEADKRKKKWITKMFLHFDNSADTNNTHFL